MCIVYSTFFVLPSHGEELSALKMEIVMLTKNCRYIYDISDFLFFRSSDLMLVVSYFSKNIYIMLFKLIETYDDINN